MDTNERVIQALHEFENMTDADKVLTQELEDVFIEIAHTGRIQIPWIYLKPVFMFKLDKVMRDFFESSPSRNSTSSEPTHTAEFDVMRQRLLDCIESFTSAPFTVQRLCELMIEPKRHYKSSEKFMRGVEKNVLVVSTMADIEGEELTNNHENTSIPNGPVTNGIISTANVTEMSSVTECESNGKHSEHYHDIHYPTPDELQNMNGNETQEKTQVNEESSIEEQKSIEDELDEKPPEQENNAENKTTESEEELKDKCNDDGSAAELKPVEQQSKELVSEQEVESNTEKEEDKNNSDSEEEKSLEDKENTKEDSIEQTNQVSESSKDANQDDASPEVPMEEN